MTSIEYLQKEYNENEGFLGSSNFEQAKEMHKQETIKFAINYTNDCGEFLMEKNAYEYYQETFGIKGSGVLTEGSGSVSNIGGAVELTLQDHVPDVREMVEDDVEKLAEERFPIRNECALDIIDLLKIKQDIYIECYNKAKENLYTEEQIREGLKLSKKIRDDESSDLFYTDDEIIQSLKQPK
jgi:hypothetical protein